MSQMASIILETDSGGRCPPQDHQIHSVDTTRELSTGGWLSEHRTDPALLCHLVQTWGTTQSRISARREHKDAHTMTKWGSLPLSTSPHSPSSCPWQQPTHQSRGALTPEAHPAIVLTPGSGTAVLHQLCGTQTSRPLISLCQPAFHMLRCARGSGTNTTGISRSWVLRTQHEAFLFTKTCPGFIIASHFPPHKTQTGFSIRAPPISTNKPKQNGVLPAPTHTEKKTCIESPRKRKGKVKARGRASREESWECTKAAFLLIMES